MSVGPSLHCCAGVKGLKQEFLNVCHCMAAGKGIFRIKTAYHHEDCRREVVVPDIFAHVSL
jgi:hypothetical protein